MERASLIPGIERHPDLARRFNREASRMMRNGCGGCDLGELVQRYASQVRDLERFATPTLNSGSVRPKR